MQVLIMQTAYNCPLNNQEDIKVTILLISEADQAWLQAQIWDEAIGKLNTLTVDRILEITVDRGQCVHDFIAHIDGNGTFPGILKTVAKTLLDSTIKSLLPQDVSHDEDFESLIDDPVSYFGIDQKAWGIEDTVRTYITRRYKEFVNIGSEEFEKRAMIAYVEFAIGSPIHSIINGTFALNEKDVPNFGDELHRMTLAATKASVDAEKLVAKILLEILKRQHAETAE
jgi:hypothetical protein